MQSKVSCLKNYWCLIIWSFHNLESIQFLVTEWLWITLHNKPFSGQKILVCEFNQYFFKWTWNCTNGLDVEVKVDVDIILFTEAILVLFKVIVTASARCRHEMQLHKWLLHCHVLLIMTLESLFNLVLFLGNVLGVDLLEVYFVIGQGVLDLCPSFGLFNTGVSSTVKDKDTHVCWLHQRWQKGLFWLWNLLIESLQLFFSEGVVQRGYRILLFLLQDSGNTVLKF